MHLHVTSIMWRMHVSSKTTKTSYRRATFIILKLIENYNHSAQKGKVKRLKGLEGFSASIHFFLIKKQSPCK